MNYSEEENPLTLKSDFILSMLMSDLFITGVNAVTAEGTLHWLDKVGNRIAPVAFGPRKVIIVAWERKDREVLLLLGN